MLFMTTVSQTIFFMDNEIISADKIQTDKGDIRNEEKICKREICHNVEESW